MTGRLSDGLDGHKGRIKKLKALAGEVTDNVVSVADTACK